MYKLFSGLAIIIISLNIFSQETDTLKLKPFRYIRIESGYRHASYRDAGASPLIYTGSMPTLNIGYRSSNLKYLIDIQSSSSIGNYFSSAGGSKYKTNAYNFDISLDYFRTIHASHEHWRILMGSGLSGFLSARNSTHYMNSSFVMNSILNLSLNGRVQYNFIRPQFESKFLFFRFSRPEKKYLLSFDLYIPFASLGHYPGFSYVSHATTGENNEFSNYKWHVHIFSGLKSRIEFFRFLNNGNACGLAYTFHIFSSKSYLTNYVQMAEQTVSLSLLYRFN